MKLSKLFVVLVALLVNSCASYKMSDFPIFVRLPASRECFEIKTISGQEQRYDAETCDKMISKSIHLTSDAWRILRGDIQKNCHLKSCKQIKGAADDLFLGIDQVLQRLPY